MATNTNSNPPKKNQEATYPMYLEDASNPGSFKANPTIAAGDFKLIGDGAVIGNLTNLPTVTPAGGRRVQIYLTAAETNYNNYSVEAIDQTSPKEWNDNVLPIVTTA